jgi:hypothetical protein
MAGPGTVTKGTKPLWLTPPPFPSHLTTEVVRGTEQLSRTQRTRLIKRQCIRGATFQVATSAPLPTCFQECRYEYRHGSLEGRSTVLW